MISSTLPERPHRGVGHNKAATPAPDHRRDTVVLGAALHETSLGANFRGRATIT